MLDLPPEPLRRWAPSNYQDPSHDNRNVTDCGPGPYREGDHGIHEMVTHQISHIVEGANNGTWGSPAFPIWGDSKEEPATDPAAHEECAQASSPSCSHRAGPAAVERPRRLTIVCAPCAVPRQTSPPRD